MINIKDYEVTICVAFTDEVSLEDIRHWLVDNFGPEPEGWRRGIYYPLLIHSFNLNSKEDLVLFNLTWGEYCV